ncbi:hypothetical protein B0J11DRAFT_550551 [Dendryphion nanum]|uniref:Nitrogen regulatory protein areA GATA-like domain-containing protein n=1 Tax=Dendryphion nanum TaxID=256645 RepID=A0A9P9DR08_9PLEO|nr:hypothetical protein B0J11DRAFT_550551 [Dendryphion nanum]
MAEVLSVAHDSAPFSHAPLRSSASHTSFFDASGPYGPPRKNAYSYTDLRSSVSLSSSRTSSFQSTPASSLSLETRLDEESDQDDVDDDDDDDGLSFPSYSTGQRYKKTDSHEAPPSSPIMINRPPTSSADSYESSAATPDPLATISEDDTAVRFEPSQHVDYLSHEWKEEDIWSSWRHIVEHRKVYGERSRLENASWRTWAKSQFKLKTVSPETLNWLKDCDVTWLYGPLQPASNRSVSLQSSEPVSRLSKTNSFLHKKPILKKRSMSEVMLQKSISSSSLVKQAAAAVQAQQMDSSSTVLARRRNRPIIGRATSDYVTSSIPSRTTSRDPTDYLSSRSTSGLQTPEHGERRHIRFDEKVEQCIAVECKDGIEDDDDDHNNNNDDSSSDEGVVMMKRSRKRKPISRTNSKASFSGENKIIAKLPSTTLKSRTDSPDVTEEQSQVATHSLGFWRSSRLSPSPSQETLRPSNPSTNFLLADADSEDEDEDLWQPTRAFDSKRPSTPTPSNPSPNMPRIEEADAGGLRRTASGMFMPFDDEDENPPPPGIIGRVVDTVNTARDIAHVIWNVGWRA